MENIRLSTDPVRFVGVRTGECTSFYLSTELYIANPQGAGGQSFDVEVRAQTPS